MAAKAKSVLVPYDDPYGEGYDGAAKWGEGPYFQIGIKARDSERVTNDGYYHSKEMLANLYREIGALLAKDAHAQS